MTPINMLVLLFCCISMRELMYLVNNSFESKGGFNWKTLRSDNHTTIWIIAYPKLSRILTTYCGAQVQGFFSYNTTYNTYNNYHANNAYITLTYKANYNKYQAILRLNTTDNRII